MTHGDRPDYDEAKAGSERSFGLFVTVIFLLIAFWPLFTKADQEGALRIWALVTAAVFCVTALTMPRFLAPLHKPWLRVEGLLWRMLGRK